MISAAICKAIPRGEVWPPILARRRVSSIVLVPVLHPTLNCWARGSRTDEKPRARTLNDLVSREELSQPSHMTRYVVDRFVDLGLPYYKLRRERWFFADEFLGFVERQLRRRKGGPKSTP